MESSESVKTAKTCESSSQNCETVEWFKERVHDKKHFTARLLAQASEQSGVEVEKIAKAATGVLAVFLVFSEQAHLFANTILIAVPIILVFAFPSEKPTDDSLIVYFSLFGLLTVMDRGLERIPAYYVLKLAFFLLLYIPPYVLHQKISDFVHDQLNAATATAKSPKSSRSSRSSRSTRTARAAPDEVSDESKPAGSGSSPNGRKSSRSSTDVAGGPGRYKDGANPMESSSFHKLKTESDGFAGTLVGPGNNLHDMLFFPMDRIVFNGPFDIDNITYHMKVVNNSHHRLAYAIKGNAVPRVMANPAFGILKSKEERLLAVTVQKFEWDDVHFEKDRIAFDYILLADNNKTEKFALDMFKKSESKRRKNILIQYNP